ncbi:Hypothetical protein A7982_11346 [Minicystis rosea]|nr:Hypothetical protein A7982_11346 [Minicystis rosea]
MKHTPTLHLSIMGCLVLTGCGADLLDGEEVDEAVSAAIVPNAIVPNAIVPNAIVPNAIVPNAIVPNALAFSAMSSGARAALTDPGAAGELSRMFVAYTVGCALKSTHSFSFAWTDAQGVVHDETYTGMIGLAPGWATEPLSDEVQQRLVSGCLAARTNYFGVTVQISLRSPQNPLKKDLTSAEVAAYPHVEGAFWGNLFTTSPALSACYNASNESIARSAQRVCATGAVGDGGQPVPCGPIALAGACSTVCPNLGGDGTFYTSCQDSSGSTNVIITSALP